MKSRELNEDLLPSNVHDEVANGHLQTDTFNDNQEILQAYTVLVKRAGAEFDAAACFERFSELKRCPSLWNRWVNRFSSVSISPLRVAAAALAIFLLWYVSGFHDFRRTSTASGLAPALSPTKPTFSSSGDELLATIKQLQEDVKQRDVALALAERVSLERESGVASGSIALQEFSFGRLDDAIHHYEKFLESARSGSPEERQRKASALNNLGQIYLTKNRLPLAIQYTLESLRVLSGDHGAYDAKAVVHFNLGQLYARNSQHVQSQEHFSQGLDLAERVYGKTDRRVGIACNNAGRSLLDSGRSDRALPYLVRAQRILAMTDHKDTVERNLAEAQRRLSRGATP